MTSHEGLLAGTEGRERSSRAMRIARRIEKHGYIAKIADHGYAVKISDADGNQLAILWMPIGEPTPTGLGFMFLWGRTGDEHQASDSVDLDELVGLITRSLS